MATSSDIVSVNEKLEKFAKKYASLKKDNEQLRRQLQSNKVLVDSLNVEISALKEQLSQAVLLQAMTVSSGDVAIARKAIKSLIKDVDRCISYLYK